MADFYTARVIGYDTVYAEDVVDALEKINERLDQPTYLVSDLCDKSVEIADGEDKE